MKNSVCRMMAVAIIAIGLTGCNSVAPDAGMEAVLVKKPMLFGRGGVDPEPVKTGRVFVAVTTDAKMVDVRPQLFKVHLDDFFTKDGVPLDFDATLRLQVKSSVRLLADFGDNWYVNNIEPEFIRFVRDAVKKHGMNEVALNVTAADEMDSEITQKMKDYIASKNLPVELCDVTLGRANPPDAVKSQRVETATQEQMQNTEKQRKLAQDQRKLAEASRAAADNAYREAMRLSPDQFLQLEQIKMLHDVCKNQGNCSFIIGGGSITPMMNVKK
jgi:regulator of protease activity HflC (stomatin/prohibitin superfamily)